MSQHRKHPSHAARQAAYRTRCQQARQEQLQARGLPALPAIPTLPGTARWKAALTLAHSLVEEICTQMQTYFDERTEVWQDSERAEDFTTRLEALQEVRDQMEGLL